MNDLEEGWVLVQRAEGHRAGKPAEKLSFGSWSGFPTAHEMVLGHGGCAGHRHRCPGKKCRCVTRGCQCRQDCPETWWCEGACQILSRGKDGVGVSYGTMCPACIRTAEARRAAWYRQSESSTMASGGTYQITTTNAAASTATTGVIYAGLWIPVVA